MQEKGGREGGNVSRDAIPTPIIPVLGSGTRDGNWPRALAETRPAARHDQLTHSLTQLPFTSNNKPNRYVSEPFDMALLVVEEQSMSRTANGVQVSRNVPFSFRLLRLSPSCPSLLLYLHL